LQLFEASVTRLQVRDGRVLAYTSVRDHPAAESDTSTKVYILPRSIGRGEPILHVIEIPGPIVMIFTCQGCCIALTPSGDLWKWHDVWLYDKGFWQMLYPPRRLQVDIPRSLNLEDKLFVDIKLLVWGEDRRVCTVQVALRANGPENDNGRPRSTPGT
jgi:hypothetical protein